MLISNDGALVAISTVARILNVSHPTAMRYAIERRFTTRRIEGRLFALQADVLRYRRDRRASRVNSQSVQPQERGGRRRDISAHRQSSRGR
jgi:hypothetical protein